MKSYQHLFAELKRRNVWFPALDPIRSHPAVHDYMARIARGDATVRRTPPERREVPTVLRRGDEAAAAP